MTEQEIQSVIMAMYTPMVSRIVDKTMFYDRTDRMDDETLLAFMKEIVSFTVGLRLPDSNRDIPNMRSEIRKFEQGYKEAIANDDLIAWHLLRRDISSTSLFAIELLQINPHKKPSFEVRRKLVRLQSYLEKLYLKYPQRKEEQLIEKNLRWIPGSLFAMPHRLMQEYLKANRDKLKEYGIATADEQMEYSQSVDYVCENNPEEDTPEENARYLAAWNTAVRLFVKFFNAGLAVIHENLSEESAKSPRCKFALDHVNHIQRIWENTLQTNFEEMLAEAEGC